ncbi:MAG: hypothetical protein RJA44_2536 [Pseudomonadota bacterium]
MPRNANTGRWDPTGSYDNTMLESRPLPMEDDLSAPATQMLRSPGDYLGSAPDIGRAVGNGTRELFISCDIGDALKQQIDHLQPSFIALHDLGCVLSRRLLAAVAAACGQAVELLVIRRAGFGTTLATIEYVDCPSLNGQPVRLYTTDADADTSSRNAVARVLLGHATMGAILLGDLPPHALTELLEPLRQNVFQGPWACQQLLFLPLGLVTTASGPIGDRMTGTGVVAHVSQRVTRPVDAWSNILSDWNQLQSTLHPDGSGPLLPGLQDGGEATEPAPLRPLSAPPPARTPLPQPTASTLQPGAAAVPRANPLERYIRGLGSIPGVVSGCVFEIQTSRVLAHLGARGPSVELARRGTTMLAAAGHARKQLVLAGRPDEVVVNGGTHSLGLRVLSSQPEWAVHLVFTPAQADWPQLRAKLISLDAALPRGPVL